MFRTKAERGHGSLHGAVSRLIAITLASLLLAGVAAAQAQTKFETKPDTKSETKPASASNHLRGGWYPWDPYQYRDYKRGVPVLTGFDVEIERALARIMGVEIDLPEIAWKDHLAALIAGTGDIAAGATASEARGLYAYFSQPYRTETDVLILPRGASRRYAFHTVEGMLDTFAKEEFRLGVVAGFVYADSRVNDFIADPAHRDWIVPVGSDAENLRNLLAGAIDGFFWPIALPPPPQPGAAAPARASKSIRCASPPRFISC
jgi:polar amino acid transport system substrate-binding protein